MKEKRKYRLWTIEDAAAEAAKFSTRFEFQKNSNNAYTFLRRAGLLDNHCSHMNPTNFNRAGVWTIESASASAAKFGKRHEFAKCEAGAYDFLRRHGILDATCAHMMGQMNLIEARIKSLKFSTRTEFFKYAYSAYEFCRKNNLLNQFCSHMHAPRQWSKDDVVSEAQKHSCVSEFRAAADVAYRLALSGGYIHECCAHMAPATNGFDKVKPATLYYLRIRTATNLVLYKIGITNRSPKSRITGMGLQNVVAIDVIKTFPFASGREARLIEKAYHREFASHAYTGDPVLGNGNTELFTADVLGLCNN